MCTPGRAPGRFTKIDALAGRRSTLRSHRPAAEIVSLGTRHTTSQCRSSPGEWTAARMFWSRSPSPFPVCHPSAPPRLGRRTWRRDALCPPGLGMLAWSHPAPRSRGALFLLGLRSTAYWGAVVVPFDIVDHDCSAFFWLFINYEQTLLPTPFEISPATVDIHAHRHMRPDMRSMESSTTPGVRRSRALSCTLQPRLNVTDGLATPGHGAVSRMRRDIVNGKTQPHSGAHHGLPGSGTSCVSCT